MVRIISPGKLHKYGIILYPGVGNLLFSTNKQVNTENHDQNVFKNSRVPEFIYFFGGQMNVKVTDNFLATFDMSIRQCQNDRLDDYISKDDYDYYSYISFGITYQLDSFIKPPPKNKARIAHSGARLKPLKPGM
jgi:hypothetical protein